MKILQFSRFDSPSIPDFWPGKALRATINESRRTFRGKRVLVTGACGFVGGHLTRALEAAGAHVIALDNDISSLRRGQLDLTGLRDRVEMFEGDVTERSQIQELVFEGDFSFIFHLASDTKIGLFNLVDGAHLLPEEKRPVIIYGCTDNGETEISPTTYDKALKVPVIGLRMCNIFGPYDLDFNDRLIPKAMRNIFRDGESPELYMNSIEHFRDYLYVEDAVRAFLHIARATNCYGHVYNLSGAHYSSTPDVLRDIVTFIGEWQDKEANVNPDSFLAKHHWNRSIRIAPSDSKATASKEHVEGTLLERESGFRPMTTFHEGLAVTAQFYLSYFNEIEQAKSRTAIPVELPAVPATNSFQAVEDSGFETIYTDDGLPVYRLKPKSFTRELSEDSYVPRPVSFVTQAYLAA